jgi:hypothetical protein
MRRHHPHVADIVAVSGSLRVRAVDIRCEQPSLAQLADELQVVVFERGRVFLERPARVDRSKIEIVGRIGLAIQAVADAARLELLRTRRHRPTPHPRQAGARKDLNGVDARVDHQRGRFREPGDREIARSDSRLRRHVHVDGNHRRCALGHARDANALPEVDVSRRGLRRQVGAEDPHAGASRGRPDSETSVPSDRIGRNAPQRHVDAGFVVRP